MTEVFRNRRSKNLPEVLASGSRPLIGCQVTILLFTLRASEALGQLGQRDLPSNEFRQGTGICYSDVAALSAGDRKKVITELVSQPRYCKLSHKEQSMRHRRLSSASRSASHCMELMWLYGGH